MAASTDLHQQNALGLRGKPPPKRRHPLALQLKMLRLRNGTVTLSATSIFGTGQQAARGNVLRCCVVKLIRYNARAQGSEHSERPAGATGYAAGGQSDEVRTLRNASNARVDHLQTMLADIWRRRMNDINDWKRYYGEERVKRAELEVATDELVEAAEMVLAAH